MAPLWCLHCRAPSAARCLDDMHDVRNAKLLLRQSLQGLGPQVGHQLAGLQDDVPDDGVLPALRLLRGAPAVCTVAVRQEGELAFSAEWPVDAFPLLQALVALAVSGRLQQEEPSPDQPTAVESPPARVESPTTVESPPARADFLELVLGDLSQAAQNERQHDKTAMVALVRQRGVRRITRLYCNHDPDWVLDVLRAASATLEELSLGGPSAQHLAAVHAMPRLRRLRLDCGNGALDAEPPVLPPLPQSTLQLLRVVGLPRPTLVSLLRAHRDSLRELWLTVGTPGPGAWPNECSDLDALLGQCDLRRLGRLVLQRCFGEPCRCGAQVAAVRRALPAATVQCRVCDKVAQEDF